MKRALSLPDPELPSSPFPKRRKLSPSGNRPYNLPSLTPESLQALSSQSSAPEDPTQSIKKWEKTVPMQTPSVSSNDSGRRASKLGYRRQRSLSPAKRNSIQYRLRNMADAGVFVDHSPEPPMDVKNQIMSIFQVSRLEDVGKSPSGHDLSGASKAQPKEKELAETYHHKSTQLAKECAGEGQWKSCLLTGLLEPLREPLQDTIKLSASEKPWIPELRPTAPSFENMLGMAPPSFPTAEPQTPPNAFLPQTPVLSPSSSAYTESTADDPNRVSIPKPDIVVGLDHASFSQLQGRILRDLQDKLQVLSEPHQSTINLHFPFFVVEAKGLVVGSNMVAAQNQVAVDAACALNILRDLKHFARTRVSPVEQPGQRHIIFSISTEGPIHELWVHYQVDEAYHMTQLRIWRTTAKGDAKEFVHALCKVLEWGANGFRTAILEELAAIETELRKRQREVD